MGGDAFPFPTLLVVAPTPQDMMILNELSADSFGEYCFYKTVIDACKDGLDLSNTQPFPLLLSPLSPFPPLSTDFGLPASLSYDPALDLKLFSDLPPSPVNGRQAFVDSPLTVASEFPWLSESTRSASSSLPDTGAWSTISLPALPSPSAWTFPDSELSSRPQSPIDPSPIHPPEDIRQYDILQTLKPTRKRRSRDEPSHTTRQKEKMPYTEDEPSRQTAAQAGFGDPLKPVKNPATKRWSCPTCKKDFKGHHETQRHITQAARCTGTKARCRYCGESVNASKNSKSRHLTSAACQTKAKRKGIKHPSIQDAFL